MSLVGNIIIGVQAQTANLKKGLDKAVSDAKGFKKVLTADIGKGLTSSLDSLFNIDSSAIMGSVAGPLGMVAGIVGGALKAAFAAAAAAAAAFLGTLAYLGYQSIDLVGDQDDLAQQLGTTQAAIARLQHAAMLAGVGGDELGSAMKKLNGQLGQPSKEFTKSVESLGIKVTDLQKMRPEQRMAAIADGLKNINSPAAQAAAAIDLFGKSGQNLLPLLSGGSEGLKEAAAEANAFGLALSGADVRSVTLLGDNLDRLGAVASGIGNQVVSFFAPAINNAIELFINWGVKTGAVKTLLGMFMTELVKWTGMAIDFAHNLATSFGEVFLFLSQGLEKLMSATSEVAKFLSASGNFVIGNGFNSNSEGDPLIGATTGLKQFNEEMRSVLTDQENWSPGATLTTWFANSQTAASKFKEEMGDANSSIAEMAEEIKKAKEAGDEFVTSLNNQLYALKHGEEAAKLYELANKGVDDATLAVAEKLQKEIKALKDAKRHKEAAREAEGKLQEQGMKLWEDNLNPLEKYNLELIRMTRLLLKGKITEETFTRAKLKLDEGLAPPEVKLASANQVGTAAAYQAVTRAQFAATKDPVADNTAKLVVLAQNQISEFGKWAAKLVPETISLGGH